MEDSGSAVKIFDFTEDDISVKSLKKKSFYASSSRISKKKTNKTNKINFLNILNVKILLKFNFS